MKMTLFHFMIFISLYQHNYFLDIQLATIVSFDTIHIVAMGTNESESLFRTFHEKYDRPKNMRQFACFQYNSC